MARMGNPNSPLWTKPEDELLVSLRRSGLKVMACARRVGRSYYATKKRLRFLRVTIMPRKNRRAWGTLKPKVKKLLRAGLPVSEVAELCGVDHSVICVIRKKLGFPPATEQKKRALAWKWRKLLAGAA